ncbi:MAG: hypothetical protein ACYC27_10605 [Armatimonadota bacterium]
MELLYKPDFAEAQQRMKAFWAGEMIDRPVVSITAPKEGKVPPPITHITAPDFDFEGAARRFDEWASCVFFGGEAMPVFRPDFGPDQFSAFIGAKMELTEDAMTSWVHPFVEDWSQVEQFKIDPDNFWWKSVLDLTRAAAEIGDGKYIIRTLDMHTNLDCLSAIRGAARLCMDLYDEEEALLKALGWVDALFKPVYDAVFEAGRMGERGSTSWSDMWSFGRTETVQCDFCYMISPEHSRKYLIPSLEYEISTLDTSVYHLDGPGQIVHVDDLVSIPGLNCIQWISGAGQPPAPAWLELLQKIQKAGKSVQVLVTADELKAIYSELIPEKTFYWVIGGCATEKEAQDLLNWMKLHS